MKTNEEKDLTLIKIIDQFPTDEAAREHLESIRWPNGIICPHCKCSDQNKFSTIAANSAKKVRAGLRWCSSCEKQFTVTIGTIFEDSHIPLPICQKPSIVPVIKLRKIKRQVLFADMMKCPHDAAF